MRNKSPLVAVSLLVVCSFLGLSSCGWRSSGTAATVNGETITVDSLVTEARALSKVPEFAGAYLNGTSLAGLTDPGSVPVAVLSAILNRRIRSAIVTQELQRLGIVLEEADLVAADNEIRQELDGVAQNAAGGGQGAASAVPAFEKLDKNVTADILRRQAADVRLRRELAGADLAGAPADAKAFFDANPNLYSDVCLKGVVFPDDAVANLETAVKALAAGKSLLDAVKSADPQATEESISIGCGSMTELPEPIRSTLARAEVKKVTGPVRTPTGKALLMVDSRAAATFGGAVEAAASADQVNVRRAIERAPYEAFFKASKATVVPDRRFGEWGEDLQLHAPIAAVSKVGQ